MDCAGYKNILVVRRLVCCASGSSFREVLLEIGHGKSRCAHPEKVRKTAQNATIAETKELPAIFQAVCFRGQFVARAGRKRYRNRRKKKTLSFCLRLRYYGGIVSSTQAIRL